MNYQATATFDGVKYTGILAKNDHDAVVSATEQLPKGFSHQKTILTVYEVYDNAKFVAYSSTYSKYMIATF
jgi:hypothetical protein